jgi:hypothetical protein
VVLCALAGGQATAAPDNGFGLAGGVTAHHVEQRWDGGSNTRYDSAGLSLAGDAQFVASERWSLNPFLQLTLERVHGDLEGAISNGSAGFQLRRWSDTLYLGVHAGYYVELQILHDVNRTRYGPGIGAAIGVEPRDALGWGLQLDLPRVAVLSETRVALSLHLAYRWR